MRSIFTTNVMCSGCGAVIAHASNLCARLQLHGRFAAVLLVGDDALAVGRARNNSTVINIYYWRAEDGTAHPLLLLKPQPGRAGVERETHRPHSSVYG